MSTSKITTDFAPAEREEPEKLEEQRLLFTETELLHQLFNAVPEVFLILNDKRQIIFANQAMLDMIDVTVEEQILGQRPGEVLDCAHASEGEGGCGTTEFCRTCGAVQAILSSLRGKEAIKECRILQRSGDALDLRVWATPLTIGEKKFSIFAVNDISHEKRRQALERIFFHDILNTAGNIQGVSWMLQTATADELDDLTGIVNRLSHQLVDEIQAQRQINAAENDQLSIELSSFSSRDFLDSVADNYRQQSLSLNKKIKIDPDVEDVPLTSDQRLLSRVIGNMLKNALEASTQGQTITLGCRVHGDELEIWVNNPTVMARTVQLQIFNRSFSTKGSGRGLGTYSIKLLTERYLQGRVDFDSIPEEGTTFRGFYPLEPTP